VQWLTATVVNSVASGVSHVPRSRAIILYCDLRTLRASTAGSLDVKRP
jgi:hypothetical protein